MDQGSGCRVWWDEVHQVARNDWKPGSVCTVLDARAVTQATAALGRGEVPVLVDMRTVSRLDRAARQHFSAADTPATAVALLIGSAVSKVIANVMVLMQRTVPTRAFTDETVALTWLVTHRRPTPPRNGHRG